MATPELVAMTKTQISPSFTVSHMGFVWKKGISWYWMLVSLPSMEIDKGSCLTKRQAEHLAQVQVMRKVQKM